jgi:hypothetical protein
MGYRKKKAMIVATSNVNYAYGEKNLTVRKIKLSN